MEIQKTSEKIKSKQKKIYAALFIAILVIGGAIVFSTTENTPEDTPAVSQRFDVPTSDVKPENIRIAQLENVSDLLNNRMHSLEKTIIDLKEENVLIESEKKQLTQQTEELREKLKTVEEMRTVASSQTDQLESMDEEGIAGPQLRSWEATEKTNDRHVLFEIPAGSVVKAVLVSGADCSVAIQKPTGPNMVLLRPLDHGKLPRNIRVPLKGSVIIGNAIGDIASERVYVRAERLTLVERNGSFVETEVSAYVSGEDGREGLRGVVVDRSGQIITRAAFASFLQGVGQTLQATLNNQVIEKLSEIGPNKSILNLDMFRNGAFQGGQTALSKLADYYVKRAEQLQPAIQIAAGRVVDVIFTKTVKIGEKDLKRKLDREREAKSKEVHRG